MKAWRKVDGGVEWICTVPPEKEDGRKYCGRDAVQRGKADDDMRGVCKTHDNPRDRARAEQYE